MGFIIYVQKLISLRSWMSLSFQAISSGKAARK